jgi:N-acetylglucosamine-6-sulfatase
LKLDGQSHHQITDAVSRRTALQSLAAGALGLFAPRGNAFPTAAAEQATPIAQATSGRPNIVCIVTDDMRADDLPYLPSVQSLLVAQGATFTHFFAPTPLCCPSRVSMLRGQYAHNHGVLRNTGDDAGFAAFLASGEESDTAATLLQDAGYQTALIGKYLNGYVPADDPRIPVPQTYVPPGWDRWVAGIGHSAYNHFDYTLNVDGALVHYGHAADDYLTDVLSGYGVAFLDHAAKAGDPFFLYLAPYAPHSPTVPAPRHEGMFRGATAPRTPAFNEADVTDKPEWIRTAAPLNERKLTRVDEDYALRLEALQAVDEMVKAVVDLLAAQNLLDASYILFLSDNGYFLGEYRQPNGKDAPYDASTRVPLIVRGPGIAAGTAIDQLALTNDFLPTFAELAGIGAPSFVDGRSLVPLWSEADPEWRQVALLEGFGREFESDERAGKEAPAFNALRTPDTLYSEYETGEHELYDLEADPWETENLASTADPALLAAFSQRVAKMKTCVATECRAIESEPLSAKTAMAGNARV